MCNPSCENKGTCISPNMCLCLDGFYGKRCEKGKQRVLIVNFFQISVIILRNFTNYLYYFVCDCHFFRYSFRNYQPVQVMSFWPPIRIVMGLIELICRFFITYLHAKRPMFMELCQKCIKNIENHKWLYKHSSNHVVEYAWFRAFVVYFNFL